MIAAKRLKTAPNCHLVHIFRSPRGAGFEPAPQQGINTAVSCYIEDGCHRPLSLYHELTFVSSPRLRGSLNPSPAQAGDTTERSDPAH